MEQTDEEVVVWLKIRKHDIDKSIKTEALQENTQTNSKSETDFKASGETKKTVEIKQTGSDKGFALNLWWILLLLIPLGLWRLYNIKN